MAQPTLTQLFGEGASIADSANAPNLAAGKKYLVIETDALGLTGASREDAERILSGIVKAVSTWSVSDTVNDSGVEMTSPVKQGFSTRGATASIAWGFSGTFYTPDTSGTVLDVEAVL